ncbi:methylthioribose kinase [Planococcus antarcticus DSM 14505]|uniref:Methylthioribose kinase n=1 Tax=Planococcus antarcticus DSM 14505 TaxID=1185653 RepID=A0A1C7DD67_9BACL|nr:S-methyl-5-thioribose kinase [Planococcus antarcticus]ANU09460.1 S-methyl-5-thioribose kinase [Planococcus antarcticus DSM 14505]EIM06231.1 methylthioribose kinase [Planococcus antarcticus DSM 14505]
MTLTVPTTYKALTEATAIALAKTVYTFDHAAQLTCREIGDGNLNYVFQIEDTETGKRIIIKQALPYAKIIGESWPLTLKRATIEANVLRKHGEFVPSLVPAVYATDEELAITVMEDLSHLEIVREGLINGQNFPRLSKDIGEYLALTLFHTSDYGLHPFEKKRLAAEFSNPELCKITEDLIFTDPFFDIDTNDYEPQLQSAAEAIWSDRKLQLEVAKLKKSFLTESEALLHGDLHTGSVFASQTETKVIDPEFGFYGPIGFDVGLFLANLIFQSITREGENRQVIVDDIGKTWEVFASSFGELWNKQSVESFRATEGYLEYVLGKVLTDATGFAGCELIRRTIGLAHVKDLDSIEDTEKRTSFKKQALETGRALILQGQQTASIDDLLEILEEARK